MPNINKTYLKFDYDEHARTRALDDFSGQVRRTVHGTPVSDDQIKLIIDTISSALDLKSEESLLDIACGNGALSQQLFDSCSEYLGIDLSEHLISIAKTNFEKLPEYQFIRQGAAEYVCAESHPARFSKVLCYGSFAYFSFSDATEVLNTLFKKFTNAQSVFIGNLPDRDRALEFYKKSLDEEELSDCSTSIGIWRTRNEFTKLANDAGWKVEISNMPAEFFNSYYRYDALLTRE
jgi:cyclopropane fatty-acyl-phospholipid synthase-like methyltransferase